MPDYTVTQRYKARIHDITDGKMLAIAFSGDRLPLNPVESF